MMRRRRTRRLINVSPIYSLFYFFLSCSSPLLWAAKDTITLNQMITYDHETNLISAGGEFELGFFSPDRASSNSNNRYLGIWYHRLLQESPLTVVWIANRDKPLKTKTGYLILDKDGSLKLLDRPGGEVFWSTVTSSHLTTDITAKLMDSGNLILTEGGENENHAIIWQSFSNESDTFLPGMKMAGTKKLRSWANENDPAPGALTLEVTQAGNRFSFVIKNGSAAYWRSGSSSDFSKSDQIPEYVTYLLSNFSASSTKEIQQNTSLVNKTLNFTNSSPSYVLDNTRLVMHPSGQIRFYNLSQNLTWDLRWWEPKDECSVHHACGPYGVCNSTNKPLCGCLEGFQPMAPEEWNSGQFSEGCLRKIRGCKKEDRFLDLKVIKVGNPDSTIEGKTEEECKAECLDKCPCKAYSVETNMRRGGIPSTCLIWNEQDLMDIQQSVSDQSRVIHVRVAAFPNLEPFCDSNKDCEDHSTCKTSTSENGKRRCICNANYQWNPSTKNCTTRTEAPLPKTGTAELHNTKKLSLSSIVKIIFATGIVLSCIIISICCLRRRTRIAKKKASRENFQESSIFHFYGSDKHAKEIELNNFGEEEDKVIDVPFFNFERVLAATEDFSNSNKLGEGGFGPVYKGKLPGGKEIAVKRLSRCSGQGLDEFKTEVLLIAKLQHRNLVRLLGYSVKGEEKMLLYQYMPNKSLDSFVFDRTRCLLLNWEKRFNIIMGIARGLLYLHQDSRLRIIHRDLKTSNILLDEEMNPKISDFGLARIVGGNETEANTTRVVGTYGYMSPEYALDGLFSVKSDVFSFGVVLLEILSGKKNTGFYQSEHSVNLLGYAWTLWREDKVLNLVDKSLRETCNACEVSKCINIGLLCVQEDADDRPTMSNVVFMLGSETPTLPTPQQPAFFGKRCPSSIFSSSRGPEMYSANEITVTVEQGR